MITPKLNINGTSASDLIDPRQQAWTLIDEVVEQLQRVAPNGRDYLGDLDDKMRLTLDRMAHYDRIATLRQLQDVLLREALAIKDQEI